MDTPSDTATGTPRDGKHVVQVQILGQRLVHLQAQVRRRGIEVGVRAAPPEGARIGARQRIERGMLVLVVVRAGTDGGAHALEADALHFSSDLWSSLAVLGTNGAGKSTLLRVFNRMFELYPDQRADGTITLDGEDILSKRSDVSLIRAKVGMVFQKPTPFPMSIYDNIAFGVRLYEKLGIKPTEIYVFLDLSDIMDEAVVYRLADELALSGWVINDNRGVTLFCVGIGSDTPLKNLKIADLQAERARELAARAGITPC